MKISKWTKWQIGAAGAIGAAILFQQVKDSPEFAQAAAEHQTGGIAAAAPAESGGTDPVVNEWRGRARPDAGGGSTAQPSVPESGGTEAQPNGTGESDKQQTAPRPRSESSKRQQVGSQGGSQTAPTSPGTGTRAKPQTRTQRS